jgi:aspartate aminotransferase
VAKSRGEKICDLTVGDFPPVSSRSPTSCEKASCELAAGETNYPPSDGVLRLREAVRELYHRALSLEVPLESVLIAGGSRPLIFTTYAALVGAGDVVVYPVPSWNNNHYCHLVGAKGIALATDPEHGFLPTAELLEPHLRTARLLALNTPLNPAGTVLQAPTLRRICEVVVAENDRRTRAGQKPLYVLYDQVYWMLTFGEAKHETRSTSCRGWRRTRSSSTASRRRSPRPGSGSAGA